MTTAAEEALVYASDHPVAEVTGEALLSAFAQVMHEWGHVRSPRLRGMRFPTLEEARLAAAGRRGDRGWNTSPLP
jgi:hypothetical protein